MEIVEGESSRDVKWTSDKALVSCSICGLFLLVSLNKMRLFHTKEEWDHLKEEEKEKILYVHPECWMAISGTQK